MQNPSPRPFSLFRLSLPLLALTIATAGCDSSGGGRLGADPPSLRSSDGLLDDPELQRVVDLQVQRAGAELTALLVQGRPEVRARAALALASVQERAAVAALLPALSDPEPSVRRDVVFALGQLRSDAVVPQLVAAYGSEADAEVRDRILEALGKTASPEAVDALLSLDVQPRDESRRNLALAVLMSAGGVSHQGGQDHLLASLDAPDERVRLAASYYFGRRDDTSVWSQRGARLRQALDGYALDDEAARYLAQGLGRLSQGTDIERLSRWATDSPDWRTRANAMLGLITPDAPGEALLAVLMAGLDDVSPHVAENAALVLSQNTMPPSALARLEAWIDGNPGRLRAVEPLMVLLARQDQAEFVLAWVDSAAVAEPDRFRIGLEALPYLVGRAATDRLGRIAVGTDEALADRAVRVLGQRWATERADLATHAYWFATFSDVLANGPPVVANIAGPAMVLPEFRAMGGLERLGSSLASLGADDTTRRVALIAALAGSNAPEFAETVRAYLTHSEARVRQAAQAAVNGLTGSALTLEDVPAGPTEPAVLLSYDPTVIDWAYLGTLGTMPRLTLETTMGRIVLRLVTEEAPQTVQTMTRLASEGRFDGVVFHRVLPNFVVQGGDVSRGSRSGGPGFSIRSELNGLAFVRGAIGMASAGKDTEGSQFFLTHSMQPHLDGGYTVFGWVEAGLDVMDRITVGDRILSATVTAGS